jgi:hypothetical protein
LILGTCPAAAFSWGDEGHEIVALIALHYLEPRVRTRVEAILATDPTGLTRGTGMAAEAVWADKFRDSDRNTTGERYRQTRSWHYIDLELDAPRLDAACFGRPPLPKGTPASQGPADDRIVDKIVQFRAELRGRAGPDERRLALQYLLHFVGDIHQPLHATDHHDHGGNEVRIDLPGHRPGNLHQYWDTVVVELLGNRSGEVADALIAGLTPRQCRQLSSGSPADWARESFEVGKVHTYGKLPIDPAYEADAKQTAALQLQRAGLRLARLLNDSLR